MEGVKPLTVVLADDDADDRELFTEAVNELNAEVYSAWNGAELMRMLAETNISPDFIFLDLNMPEKGGKECLEELRAQSRYDDVPIVIYSTSSSSKDIDDTFSLGANLYITKPTSFAELRKIIRDTLSISWPSPLKTNRGSFVLNS